MDLRGGPHTVAIAVTQPSVPFRNRPPRLPKTFVAAVHRTELRRSNLPSAHPGCYVRNRLAGLSWNRARKTDLTEIAQPLYRRTLLDLRVLDALRGLAALYVVFCHAGALLWYGFVPSAWAGENGLDAIVGRIVHGLLDYSPVAVLLFFLISGFCIHYRQARALTTLQPGARSSQILSLRDFAMRRLRRLYPPFLLALVLTAGFDALGSHLNDAFYNGPKPDQISWLGNSHALQTVLGNLAIQSTLSVPTFGTDSPLWSLAYEFWFYAGYPILLLVTARHGSVSMLGLTGLCAVVAYAASRVSDVWLTYVIMTWCVWAAGAVLAEAYVGRIRLPGLRWFVLPALVGLGLLTQRAPYHFGGRGQPKDILWACCLAILLAYILLDSPPRLATALERTARRLAWLGHISYSLYLVHVPWLALLAAAWFASHAGPPHGLELLAVGVASSIALGGACWFLVERHYMTPRTTRTAPAVGSRLAGDRRPSPPPVPSAV